VRVSYKQSQVLSSLLVAVAGLVTLAQVLTFHVHHHRFGRIDDSLLPFTATQTSHLFTLSIGILLLYLSIQIYRRKQLAYQLVSLGLAALISAEIFDVRNWVQLAFYIVTLTLLLLTRSQYNVASSNFSLRRGALMAGLILLVVFVYASIGFSELSSREVGKDISVPAAMKYAAREIFTFQESQLPLRTRDARWFVASVNTAATVAYTLTIFSLFRPLQFEYGASRRDRELARQILSRHSINTEDYFKLWPSDKHYFFSTQEDAFLAYKVVGSDAWILGGPSGNAEHFADLLVTFSDFCQRNGWSAATVNTAEDFSGYVEPESYQRLFIGNEAVIDVPTFAAETYRSKHFRYIKNRAERDGVSFDYWPAPLTTVQINRLRRVSNAWLGNRSRREYTFALGYFEADYLKNCDVAVLQRGERLIAYANVVPSFVTTARTIDHMRYVADMPSTGMHYLLMQLILRFHDAGIHTFNLGLAPLSGLEARSETNLPERLLAALKKLGANYYSFGGLEQFKNKFEPSWQARYIYYQGNPARLLRLATSLTRTVSMPVAGRWRRIVIISLSILAGLGYASFPIAIFINSRKTFHGLASELGAGGQDYAWLFNSLDVVSSLAIFAIIWLLWRSAGSTKHGRQILLLLGLSALGNLLAAVTPLPIHANSQLQVRLHDVFSVINLFGIVVAAILLTIQARFNRWLMVLCVMLVGAIIVSGVTKDSLIDSGSQRVQIVLTAVWIVIIAIYFSKVHKSAGK
jgi:phosphatidylglycerol lysyltransferase